VCLFCPLRTQLESWNRGTDLDCRQRERNLLEPAFCDEFADPDIVRVGSDFYFLGSSMHVMPGLAVLHSRDLVNWDFESYALGKLDLGPEYRPENGKNVYGQGIWAPSFRYHDGQVSLCAGSPQEAETF
jgi:beta-xylosidase